jgi:hypothetical protein
METKEGPTPMETGLEQGLASSTITDQSQGRTPTSSKRLSNTPKYWLPKNESTPTYNSKSKTISHFQDIFNDSQKIAYVGLCYLTIHNHQKTIKDLKKSHQSYTKWSTELMEKLYIYLDLPIEEQKMIKDLSDHGLVPSDLSLQLINDANDLIQKIIKDDDEPPMDIRFTLLSHLFLISISEGIYDSRARSLLKSVAKELIIDVKDLVGLESYIANELRLSSNTVKHDEGDTGKRNIVEATNRWLYAGAATLVGGAVIGLTAGLAAPFIGLLNLIRRRNWCGFNYLWGYQWCSRNWGLYGK